MKNKPEENAVVAWFLEAYGRLATSRNQYNRVPVSEITSYCTHYDIITTQEDFIDIIQAIDTVYNNKAEK